MYRYCKTRKTVKLSQIRSMSLKRHCNEKQCSIVDWILEFWDTNEKKTEEI